jgi:hypothetical protein
MSSSQILTSENWTDVISNVLISERGQVQTVIAAIFLAGWLLFAYCTSSHCTHVCVLYAEFLFRFQSS